MAPRFIYGSHANDQLLAARTFLFFQHCIAVLTDSADLCYNYRLRLLLGLYMARTPRHNQLCMHYAVLLQLLIGLFNGFSPTAIFLGLYTMLPTALHCQFVPRAPSHLLCTLSLSLSTASFVLPPIFSSENTLLFLNR